MSQLGLVDRWLRRGWHADPAAIAALPGQRPVAVVTGGSEGIGLAIATELASRGNTVLLVARNADRLEAAAANIAAAHPDATVEALALDLTDADAVAKLKSWLAQAEAYVDILVNNAGIGAGGEFTDHPADQVEQLVTLNVTAATNLMRAVLPDMLVRGRGGVLNIASLGGFAPGPYQPAYYASKAYLVSLTRAVAWEIRGRGVRLCVVVPGPVETRFHARMGADNALYRWLLPAMTPCRLARSALFAYDLGRSVVVPGLFNRLMAVLMNILPPSLLAPIIAVLLKPRGAGPSKKTPPDHDL